MNHYISFYDYKISRKKNMGGASVDGGAHLMKFLELKKSLECLCSIQNSSFLHQFQISILEPISTLQMAVKMDEIKSFLSGNCKGS